MPPGGGRFYSHLAFRPDGRQFATTDAKTFTMWDVLNGHELFTLAAEKDYIQAISFSPDGKRLVSGGNEATANISSCSRSKDTILPSTAWPSVLMEIASQLPARTELRGFGTAIRGRNCSP